MKALRIVIVLLFLALRLKAQPAGWVHLSTENGDIPMPWTSTEQTGALVADLNKDGVNDFVLSCRKQAPALVWYQRTAKGWTRRVIEEDMLTVEAGGVAYDIDGDGDLDLLFGGDWQSREVWWWENPFPDLNAKWERHIIKNDGGTQHHDQAIGKFKNNGAAELVFWNQSDRKLLLADIPHDPKKGPWPYKTIFQASASDEKHGSYVEGITTGDVDGDGLVDIIAGDHWFKYDAAADSFRAIRYASAAGCVAAGKFRAGKTLQIVVSPGDGQGPVIWYECVGNPEDSAAWKGHDLAGRTLIHGHSLQVADINGDGNLDIFVAEMAKWTESKKEPDNPNAQAFIFYGDGKGNFRKTIFLTGFGFHEARVADLDGDGKMDILSKPYNWKTPRIDIWLQKGSGTTEQKKDVGKDTLSTYDLYQFSNDKLVQEAYIKYLTPREIKFIVRAKNKISANTCEYTGTAMMANGEGTAQGSDELRDDELYGVYEYFTKGHPFFTLDIEFKRGKRMTISTKDDKRLCPTDCSFSSKGTLHLKHLSKEIQHNPAW